MVGETTAEDRFLVKLGGETKADLPLKALSGEAPEYDRPWEAPPPPPPLGALPEMAPLEALLRLMAHPNHCSRAWVWQQYDSQVMADTLQKPGGDAAVVRVHGARKALAFTADVTPRYVAADPFEGGKQAVAEAFRNLCAVGARPLAATDNLNFGNPEKPAIMGHFVLAIRGIGEACRALDMPIVSGNVSLYNETDGRAIPPTPTIGGVGLIDDHATMVGIAPRDGDALVLLGENTGWLGQSALLADVFGREEGAPPAVDLAAEARTGDLVRILAASGAISAAHDLSDGGLALAAAEMALAADLGVAVADSPDLKALAWFFGEDQARYLVACADPAPVLARAQAAGVAAAAVGRVGGDRVALGDADVPLATLRAAHGGGFARMMGEG